MTLLLVTWAWGPGLFCCPSVSQPPSLAGRQGLPPVLSSHSCQLGAPTGARGHGSPAHASPGITPAPFLSLSLPPSLCPVGTCHSAALPSSCPLASTPTLLRSWPPRGSPLSSLTLQPGHRPPASWSPAPTHSRPRACSPRVVLRRPSMGSPRGSEEGSAVLCRGCRGGADAWRTPKVAGCLEVPLVEATCPPHPPLTRSWAGESGLSIL